MLTVSKTLHFEISKFVIANHLRQLLEGLKRNTERHKMVRDALINYLSSVDKVDLPNIAEELKVSIYTVKRVLKNSQNKIKQMEVIESARERWAKEREELRIIKTMALSKSKVVTVKDMKNVLKVKLGKEMSSFAIRARLKKQGFKWRKKLKLEPYNNTQINIDKRMVFSAQVIFWLERGYNIINVDETSFNSTSNK